MRQVEIRPASSELWPLIADLFTSTSTLRWCWCQFWRKPGSNWTNTTPADNRADLEALVGADPAPGIVALEDGLAVGWVGLGPREAFPRMTRSRVLPQLPGERVWVVNCFVVARRARGRGIADALLAAAVEYARAHGAALVEGIPVDTGGERMPSASAYTGTRGMFERAGFEEAARSTSKASGGRPRVVMRRDA
jgi:GNAT superfamily N-acetyltransferase